MIPPARWEILRSTVWPAISRAFALLPRSTNTAEARVLLLAIGLQESRFLHRAQLLEGGGKGPARGFWQFERGGGCAGVLTHEMSRTWMGKACALAGVPATPDGLWRAIETDDVLAAVAARLLLYTDPRPLPAASDAEGGWAYYLRNWRPGRPHPQTWPELHAHAVEAEARLSAPAAPVTHQAAPVAAIVSPSPQSPGPSVAEGPVGGGAATTPKEPARMSTFDWKSTVQAVAPALAGAFGGPLAGMATKILGDVLFGDPDAPESRIADAISTLKPEEFVKLKEAERAFLLRMRELDVEIYRADQADRGSARSFWQALVPSERGLLFGLAFAVLGLFGYSVWWVLNPEAKLPADPMKVALVGTVIGYVSAKADQVISFFYGSSSGSQKKTDQMADALSSLAKK